MTKRVQATIIICFAMCFAAFGVAAANVADESSAQPVSGITTLYALDAVTSHLSLKDGMPGTIEQGHLTYNRDSQLSFNTYVKDSFRVGIQGNEHGAIVDLGDDSALTGRYGYKETVGNVQGFASIHLENGSAVIVKDYQSRTFQPLVEFDELNGKRKGDDAAAVVLGHMYLVRISSRGDSVPLYAKLKVLSYTPGQFVTIRWARL